MSKLLEKLLEKALESELSDTKTTSTKEEISIAILQRGWVVIGYLRMEGEMYHMRNSHVIRKWGTSKGLGELALEGKQSETILDKAGGFSFHVLTTVGIIPCVQEKWTNSL